MEGQVKEFVYGEKRGSYYSREDSHSMVNVTDFGGIPLYVRRTKAD